MMAGTFLDVESTNDQAAARLAEQKARFDGRGPVGPAPMPNLRNAARGAEEVPTAFPVRVADAYRASPSWSQR